jgi:hypothetical protein
MRKVKPQLWGARDPNEETEERKERGGKGPRRPNQNAQSPGRKTGHPPEREREEGDGDREGEGEKEQEQEEKGEEREAEARERRKEERGERREERREPGRAGGRRRGGEGGGGKQGPQPPSTKSIQCYPQRPVRCQAAPKAPKCVGEPSGARRVRGTGRSSERPLPHMPHAWCRHHSPQIRGCKRASIPRNQSHTRRRGTHGPRSARGPDSAQPSAMLGRRQVARPSQGKLERAGGRGRGEGRSGARNAAGMPGHFPCEGSWTAAAEA